MKIKNVTLKPIFRKVEDEMKSFEPCEVYEVPEDFALSSGLNVLKNKASKTVKKTKKSVKKDLFNFKK